MPSWVILLTQGNIQTFIWSQGFKELNIKMAFKWSDEFWDFLDNLLPQFAVISDAPYTGL